MADDALVNGEPDATMRSPMVAEGFDAFFVEHHDVIVRALSLALADDDLGRDAAAEGFTRALQRWNKVSRYENPTGWIYRVGLNWARSRRRKTMHEIASTPSQHEPVSNDAVGRLTDPRIIPALQALSPEHRAVVVGKFYLDWSEQQLATALDIRPGTVKSRLSRALTRLADDLGPA